MYLQCVHFFDGMADGGFRADGCEVRVSDSVRQLSGGGDGGDLYRAAPLCQQ